MIIFSSFDAEKFNAIAHSIVKLFPKEKKDIYFLQGYSIKVDPDQYRMQHHSGTLIRAYDNARDRLSVSDPINKNRSCYSKKKDKQKG